MGNSPTISSNRKNNESITSKIMILLDFESAMMCVLDMTSVFGFYQR